MFLKKSFSLKNNFAFCQFLSTMSKKKIKKGKMNPKSEPPPPPPPALLKSSSFCSNPIFEDFDQKTISLKILAKPGAKQNSITAISSEGIGIQIAAPPVDGEANLELMKYVCKLLGIRKSDVSLDKGSKSRSKILKITAKITKETILEKFEQEIKNS